MKKNLLAIIVLIGLVGYGVYDYVSGNKEETNRRHANEEQTRLPSDDVPIGIEKGQRAPDFTLNDLNGSPIRLSNYLGKKVLINFWASWCPPCRAEMPHMQQFYEDYKDNTVILGVNMTATEERSEDIRPFVEEFGLTFPIVLDKEGNLMGDYVVIAYPTTYVIDEQGIIRDVFRGAINYEIMQKTIEEL